MAYEEEGVAGARTVRLLVGYFVLGAGICLLDIALMYFFQRQKLVANLASINDALQSIRPDLRVNVLMLAISLLLIVWPAGCARGLYIAIRDHPKSS